MLPSGLKLVVMKGFVGGFLLPYRKIKRLLHKNNKQTKINKKKTLKQSYPLDSRSLDIHFYYQNVV